MQRKNYKPRYVIAIAAGKGGVGKSSVTVNLACALQKKGFAVGVLDADLYGPSLGRMMPAEKKPVLQEDQILPGECFGVKVFSISYVRPEEESVSVRAPIVNGWIKQFVKNIFWGDLDYLLVDFPPGTGDIQLTLMQEMAFFGAILVTTPQQVAVLDVKKAAYMFHQMAVPVVGVIENMAYFGDEKPFGEGGGKNLSDYLGVPFLGQLPLDPIICQCGDFGKNIFDVFPESTGTQAWKNLVGSFCEYIFEQEVLFEGGLKEFVLEWEEM